MRFLPSPQVIPGLFHSPKKEVGNRWVTDITDSLTHAFHKQLIRYIRSLEPQGGVQKQLRHFGYQGQLTTNN